MKKSVIIVYDKLYLFLIHIIVIKNKKENALTMQTLLLYNSLKYLIVIKTNSKKVGHFYKLFHNIIVCTIFYNFFHFNNLQG